MTRAEFVAKATRKAQQAIGVPGNWWGTWDEVTNGTIRVTFMRGGSGGWRISRGKTTISNHASRSSAIAKARKL